MTARPVNARWKTISEAARIYDCTPPAIRKAMEPGGALAKAVKKKGAKRYIDSEHAQALAYRSEHRVLGATGAPTNAVSSTDADIPEDIRKVWDWTIERVFAECGSVAAFDKLMAGIERVENIHAKRMTADRLAGDLVSRDFVRKHVFGLVEQLSQRLLNDLPITLSYVVHGKCKTGASAEDIQQAIRTGITREIKSAKADVTKEIKNAAE